MKTKPFNECWEPEPYSGCWLWTHSVRSKFGYGRVYRQCKAVCAHRVSWEIHRGIIPQGMYVLHRCDTPSCVNPDHLFLGTKGDNMRDCIAKGRFPQGEQHCRSKLTDEQVREIRSSTDSYTVLARRYDIDTGHAYRIKVRRLWKHIL